MLLINDPRVDLTNSDSIIIEAATSFPEILKLFLDDGRLDPGFQNNTAIFRACEQGYFENIKLLLADPRVNPVDPNMEISCFKVAFLNNDLKSIKVLLKDPRIDPTGYETMAYMGYYTDSEDESDEDESDEDEEESDEDEEEEEDEEEDEEDEEDRINEKLSNRQKQLIKHELVMKFLDEDKEKYPTFEIRQQILPLENKIQELYNEKVFYESVYANTDPNNTKVQSVATVMVQMLDSKIRKLKQEIFKIRQDQENFKRENS